MSTFFLPNLRVQIKNIDRLFQLLAIFTNGFCCISHIAFLSRYSNRIFLKLDKFYDFCVGFYGLVRQITI